MAAAEAAVRATGWPHKPVHDPDAVRLYTAEEASQRLGSKIVTPSWLRERFRRREIPGVLIAGKVAFRESDLIAIVQQHEVAPDTQRQSPAPRRRPGKPPAAENNASAVTQLRARPPQRRRSA